MHISTIIPTFLALAAGTLTTSANPVPVSEVPDLSASATVVDVASSTYSSLIVYNPASDPTSTPGSDEFLTPTGVDVPRPSTTLSFQGSVPSVSASSESRGVRVVGQDGGISQQVNSNDGSGAEDKTNSATVGGVWMGLVIAGVGVTVAAIGDAGWM